MASNRICEPGLSCARVVPAGVSGPPTRPLSCYPYSLLPSCDNLQQVVSALTGSWQSLWLIRHRFVLLPLYPYASEGMTVNMHRLGESFVEKVVDVRRRVTVDGKATALGESLEFLALIQGWQSEARRERREQLLKLNDIGLRIALEHATVKDVFFIPEVHFAEEKPMLVDDDGCWYKVRSVIWCRTCE